MPHLYAKNHWQVTGPVAYGLKARQVQTVEESFEKMDVALSEV